MMAQDTNRKVNAESEDNQNVMPFGKQNYIIVLIGLALIVLGFILMIGGGSDNPDVFNEKCSISNTLPWRLSWFWPVLSSKSLPFSGNAVRKKIVQITGNSFRQAQ